MAVRDSGVVLVRDGFDTHQLWPYQCMHCRHVWEESYVLRRVIDGRGHEAEIWTIGGVPVQPPWAAGCCPRCGTFHVTSFPAGYLSRHPELVSAPEPAPGTGARPAPVQARRAPVARTPRVPRLLVALGVPALLVAGYEIYLLLAGAGHTH